MPLTVRRVAALLIAGAALHPACSESTEIHASDFDQSCVVDSDCSGVFDGEVCGDCGPTHAATVASSATKAFDDRRSAIARTCGGVGCGGGVSCPFAWGVPDVRCATGTCVVCVDCLGTDAGNEPDVGFASSDAQTCLPDCGDAGADDAAVDADAGD